MSTKSDKPKDKFWLAYDELTATLIGLQNKMYWPDYQAPWEKARQAILDSYKFTYDEFYAELKIRLAAKKITENKKIKSEKEND